MTALPRPGPELEVFGGSLSDVYVGDDIQRTKSPVSETLFPVTSIHVQPKSAADISSLRVPFTGHIRSHSPDARSIHSLDTIQTNQSELDPDYQDTNGDHPTTPPGFINSIRSRAKAVWVRNYGLALVLLAQFFGTLMNVTTRLLEVEGEHGKGLHPFQILFARMSITVVLASVYMYRAKTPHFPFGAKEVRPLLVARGLGGFFGVFGMYYSLLYLPLAEATVITFLAPSIACWACSILINEPFTRLQKIAAGVSFFGVILIARPTSFFMNNSPSEPPAAGNGDVPPIITNGTAPIPPGGHAANYDNVTAAQRAGAVGMALIGVLGAASAFTTIRWIGKRAHPLISVNYFATWCTIVSIVMMFVLPDVGFLLPRDLKEWAFLIFLGVCGFIFQYLLAAGLQYEKSSRATNMTYTQMLFALTFDKLIFGTTPGALSLIGSSLILGSAVFVAIKNDTNARNQPQKPADSGDEERGLLDEEDGTDTEPDSPVREMRAHTPRV